MAAGTPTITLDGRSAQGGGRGRGRKCLTGRIVLSANSSFKANGIEKYFRKCYDIQVNIQGGWNVLYSRATTRLSGLLIAYNQSSLTGSTMGATSAHLKQAPLVAASSGSFVAFGI